ncbi:MAG TPA: saccharopine dehydrogenase C-terminal domain-containing protein [Terracidiphilus sp.]|nr:saccharopine dehydrogenase C-terminal domain-containing protein [Terracidiphilus sp.]
MSRSVVVLGAGRVGKVISADLSNEFDVTCADVNSGALGALSSRHRVRTRTADLNDAAAVSELVRDTDLVVCAVPGHMGFHTLKTVIESGRDVVDLSFFPEDAFALNDLAIRNNVTAAVDCGVAPGTPDFLAGYHAGQMQIQTFEFMVGGLHFNRTGPDQYLPTFSPSDVWEEYTRPARYVTGGEVVTMPPLSEPEMVEFRIGGHELRLEAFNTDGLRTLITTMKGRIPDMREKTLRFPGHIAYIRALQESGRTWIPDRWTPKDDEDEFTIMRINLSGMQEGRATKIHYTLFVTYDSETGMSSMSRATGHSCAAVARCILDGAYKRPGISPPSYIGEAPGCAERIFSHLRTRKIIFERNDEDGH